MVVSKGFTDVLAFMRRADSPRNTPIMLVIPVIAGVFYSVCAD